MTKSPFGQFGLLLALVIFASLLPTLPTTAGQLYTPGYVQVQCLRSNEQMDHLFLASGQTVSYNASPRTSDGLSFDSFSVQMNSTSFQFLHELTTDLYVESYNYFGVLGAWTSRLNFTITNPTPATQELFLKIVRNYVQTTYALDNANGAGHTFTFSTVSAADRVFVRWGFFGAFVSAFVNGSQLDVDNPLRRADAVRVEYLPAYVSFQVIPGRIQNTNFSIHIEERSFVEPSGYCYISALLVQYREVTVMPKETFLFDLPAVNGWNFLAAAVYTNLTASAYPQPYPLQLVNMSVWDPTQSPLLATALDITFGVRNISNKTWALSFDLLFYYWENQTALTFTHHILGSTMQALVHEVAVNVSDALVGSDLGLSGQFLRFQAPGVTTDFEAPDAIGKYPQSYIPLRQGSYRLVTIEPRVSAEVTSQIDDLLLTNTLHFNVTYGGDPYPNAVITVTQKGTLSHRTYTASTNQNGQATINVHSGGPEQVQLNITVAKDQDNISEQTLSYFVGATWIAVVAVLVVVFLTAVWLVLRRCKKRGDRPK